MTKRSDPPEWFATRLGKEEIMSQFARSVVFAAALFLLLLPSAVAAAELEVAELISAIKQAVTDLQKTAKKPYIKIPWIEAEVSYVVKTEAGGGLKIYVVTAEGKYATEAVQRTKYRLEFESVPRVEGPGEFKNVTLAGFDPKQKKIFILEQDSTTTATFLSVAGRPQVEDKSGTLYFIKNWDDLKGKKFSVKYSAKQNGDLEARKIIVAP